MGNLKIEEKLRIYQEFLEIIAGEYWENWISGWLD
jgi:hypothetical protein